MLCEITNKSIAILKIESSPILSNRSTVFMLSSLSSPSSFPEALSTKSHYPIPPGRWVHCQCRPALCLHLHHTKRRRGELLLLHHFTSSSHFLGFFLTLYFVQSGITNAFYWICIIKWAALGLTSRQRYVRKRGLRRSWFKRSFFEWDTLHVRVRTFTYFCTFECNSWFLTIPIQHRMHATQIKIPVQLF